MTKVQKRIGDYGTIPLEKASATVIPAKSFVKLVAGLAVIDDDAGTKIGYTEAGAAAGEVEVLIAPKDTTFKIDATTNFAVAQRTVSYDLKTTSDVQELDQAATTTAVLTVMPFADGGVVGSKENVSVRIAEGKHLLD